MQTTAHGPAHFGLCSQPARSRQSYQYFGAGIFNKFEQRGSCLFEFLTGAVAQQLGTVNYEYPVNPAVAPPPELASWGNFRDTLPIERLAELAPEAQMIRDQVGW